MTENLKLQPKKGILKNKNTKPSGAVMFDEANLNADPERGTRQKISEPKTPYHHSYSASHESDASHSAESEEDEAPICITALTQRIEQHQQQTEHREQFEAKRKAHYNEFQSVKNLLAKKGNLSDESDSE
jgi:hypothetical protein